MPGYNDGPLATDRINDTQAPIRENFNTIDTAWQVNHVDFTDAADFGKHVQIDCAELVNHPLIDADDISLYNFESTITNQPELYVKRAGAFGVAGTPFTASGWDAGTLSGWTYLPSGLLVKFGVIDWIAAGGVAHNTYALPVAATIPVFTAVYNCQFTTVKSAAGVTDAIAQLDSFGPVSITYNIGKISAIGTVPASNVGVYYSVFGV